MASDDRSPEVAAVTILFLTLTWIFVSLRCYVRAVMTKSFGMDDWLAIASLTLFTLYCTFVLEGVQYGTGKHIANIPPENLPIGLKWWWFGEIFYTTSTAMFKASIGVFLARICVTRSQINTIRIVIGVVIAYSIYYLLLLIFQCSPASYFWTQYSGASGSCVDPSLITSSSYAHAAISCLADWTLAILPIFLVWDLSMNPGTKISVSLILALGAFGSTATIVRIPFLKQLAQSDFLYSTTDIGIWSTVEIGIGITCAAMATLRPLFRTFFSRSKLFGSSTATGARRTTWHISRNATHAGYFRSGSGNKNGDEELGLRSDLSKGVGVTTTIKSVNNRVFEDEESSQESKKERSRSRKGSNWLDNETPVTTDSENTLLRLQTRAGVDWAVTKTTEVTTSQEIEPARKEDGNAE